MAARHAKAQMDPGIPHLQTFLTAFRVGRDLANLIAMRAYFCITPLAPDVLAKSISGGHFAFDFFIHKFLLNLMAGEQRRPPAM